MHQAIELLLKRMESNPEEFAETPNKLGVGKWMRLVDRYRGYFTEEEGKAFQDKLRELRMNELQKEIMAELLYGEERRRAEAEDLEYERRAMMAQTQTNPKRYAMTKTQMQIAQAQVLGNGVSITSSNPSNQSFQIGQETLDESIIAQLKRLIK
jgi:uncharacterized protein YlxW (UPF0749 family)